MFEDLIGKGKSIINKVVDYDIQKQCPYCKGQSIVKRYMAIAMRKQPAYCPKCKNYGI
ncbi:hypothetical protein LCGC14_1007530 [marine sediment metagenome]|uniref:Uncharacterized protein n=1 Tax=marine sediment metagenome TaxID=412755 RepID=A0A0F9N1C2_9ZZZZ